jgi:hypothetical protein
MDIPVHTISFSEFESLCANSEILRWKNNLPRLMRHNDNQISKIWKRRSKPSSDWIYPYYLRFVRNARKLLVRGINAPNVRSIMKVEKNKLHIVTYDGMSGASVRDILKRNKGMISLKDLGFFIATLHKKGIFFTSLHLGNIIRLDSGDFGIIDVANTHFFVFPLTIHSRARNLSHFLSYTDDVDLLRQKTNGDIVNEYLNYLNVSCKAKERLSKLIQKKCKARLLKQ